MKPGIVNEALPDLFYLQIGILMFHLLHVDIKCRHVPDSDYDVSSSAS